METAFALFIWPGIVLGGLIAYGYFTSRTPKSPEERAAEEEKAISELNAEFHRLEARIAEIDQMIADERAVNEEQAALLRRIQPLRTGVFVRHKNPVRADFRAGRLMFTHGS